METLTGSTPRRLSTRPSSELLSVETAMGAVSLRVADLDAMTAYYRDGVRLEVLKQHGADPTGPARVVLGRLGTPIVVLESEPGLRHAGPRDAGLYHTAIVFERRADLAAAVYGVASRYPHSFMGSSDHGVSEAFYFTDLEGNGVELYWDRDRTEWSWVHGVPQMSGAYLDPNAFLREHLDPTAVGAPAAGDAQVGHLHLAVGDLRSARDFYVDKLGFEAVAELQGTALFVSAGGYHHHMAMNTWNSRGAGRRGNTLGLGLVRIGVPTADDVGELDERLVHHGLRPGHESGSLLFADPWGNAVEVSSAPMGASA